MQIQHPVHTSNKQPEWAVLMKEGDVFRAIIKEGKGPNEALLSVRGREFVASLKARFHLATKLQSKLSV